MLATSVTIASGPSDPAHGPASPSSSPRQSVAGAASTIRSAPAMACSGLVAARSMTPSATACAGPAPDGLQAVTDHGDPAVPSSRCRARAIDPPMRPNPSRATRIDLGERQVGRPDHSTQPVSSEPGTLGGPPRRRPARRSPRRRSPSTSGGPGSSGGFCRRWCRRRSLSRRSSLRDAPQRGQRRSSAKSDSIGATV